MAPYEADAQMAFLAISGSVHAVITEDSDLLTYGCPRVRFTPFMVQRWPELASSVWCTWLWRITPNLLTCGCLGVLESVMSTIRSLGYWVTSCSHVYAGLATR